MSHIFCSANSGNIIQSYSPEVTVHPYLNDSAYFKNMTEVSLMIKSSLISDIFYINCIIKHR